MPGTGALTCRFCRHPPGVYGVSTGVYMVDGATIGCKHPTAGTDGTVGTVGEVPNLCTKHTASRVVLEMGRSLSSLSAGVTRLERDMFSVVCRHTKCDVKKAENGKEK